MALNAGSVTVSTTDGSYTGTGLAKAIMDGYAAAVIPATGGFPASQGLTVKIATTQLWAAIANSIAQSVVSHITANAVVPAGALKDAGGGQCTGSTTVT